MWLTKKQKEVTKKTDEQVKSFKEARERAIANMLSEEIGFVNGRMVSVTELFKRVGMDKKAADTMARKLGLIYDMEMHTEWKRIYDYSEELTPSDEESRRKRKITKRRRDTIDRYLRIMLAIGLPIYIIWVITIIIGTVKGWPI